MLLIIAAMTTICVLGTELSAHIQRFMIFAQVGALLLFAVVALVKGGRYPLSWFSPFAIDSTNALILGVLTGCSSTGAGRAPSTSTRRPRTRTPRRGLPPCSSTVILLVTYVIRRSRWSRTPGSTGSAEFEDDAGHLRRAGRRRARLAARQAGRARDHHLGAVLDADDDPAGLADDALDGPPGRVPRGVRRGAPALPHPHVSTIAIGGDRGGLVRRAVPAVGELRLRLAHGAVADDRLLLRAHRVRVRDLLPPRADQVGEELPLHRGRARWSAG